MNIPFIIFFVFTVLFIVGICLRWKERKTTYGKFLIGVASVSMAFSVIMAIGFAFIS